MEEQAEIGREVEQGLDTCGEGGRCAKEGICGERCEGRRGKV